MSLSYTDQWKQVENTINDRLLDDSLLHTLNADKKIKKQTKTINEKLKKFRSSIRSYKHFVRLKRQAERTCESNDETDDEPGLDYEAYKKLYSQQPKSHLKTFLRTCTRTPRKPRIRDPYKSNESPTFKRPSLSRANVSKNQVKPTGKTSISNSMSFKSKLSSEDTNDEKKCIEEIVDELISSNIQKETVDPPLESLSIKVGLAAVEDTPIVDNLSEELAASQLKYDLKDSSESCYGLENKSKVPNNDKGANCIAICDVTDELNAADPRLNCIEIPNKDNLLSQEDIFMTDDEKPSLQENLDNLNNDQKYIDVFYFDSGNHSCSDTNILRDRYPESSVGVTPLLSDYHDEKIIAENYASINEDESIPTNNVLRLVKEVTTRLNQTMDMVSLGDDLTISEPEFRCKNSPDEKILFDSNSNCETSQEIPFATPICYSQLKDEFPTESTANDTTIKLKIRTIEQYNEGYECFSTYQSHKQKKFKTVNNSMEDKSPSEHEQPLKPRKFSEDFNSPRSESHHLNGLIDRAAFSSSFKSNQENVDKSTDNKSSLEVEEHSEGDISEIQSHHLNQSFNSSFSSFSARSCNESFKNSVKIQLLSEIEQRLKGSPTSKNRSPHAQSQKLNGSFHNEKKNSVLSLNSNAEDIDDQSIDYQLMIEDDEESSESNRSTTELTLSEIHLQSSDRFANVEDTLPTLNSTPTERRILSSEKEHCSLENTLRSRELPRLDKQSTNKQLELISDEHKSQGSISHEMQLTKEKDDSVEKGNELNTCENIESKKKKIRRPRNLEEFVAANGLTQDITEAHFRLKDIGEDDEIWIMDVPKTINPEDLKDQMILLGGKRELRFGDDLYKISSKPTKGICNFSCMFTTSRRKKQYEIVNIEPKGNIKFRKKLSVVPEMELIPSQVPAVPFPKNLKMRHPLFGAAYKDKI